MKRKVLLALLMGIAIDCFLFQEAFGAGMFTAFGPKDYVRERRAPRVSKERFSVVNPGAAYTVRIYNGGKDGHLGKASLGVIKLNGRVVSWFMESIRPVTSIERPVRLSKSNRLSVTILGKIGSGVTVEFIGVDDDPPGIVATLTPSPNPAGWNNSDVTVSFECADATSGIASCSGPVWVTSEGKLQPVTGTATDVAGNSSSITVAVNLDKTPPNLAVTPETYEEPALEILYISDFELVWNDRGSGATHDGSFYKPRLLPSGYYALGHYGQGNYDSPNGSVAVVKELIPGALASPVGYALIWKDSGSGADRDGAFWKPIPPAGYKCVGTVVTGYPCGGGYAPPSLDAVRCVREDLAAKGKASTRIWIDVNSDASSDVGTWFVGPHDDEGVYLGLMTAQSYGRGSNYTPPESDLWVLKGRKVESAEFPLNDPALEVLYVNGFDPVWNDRGSGAAGDGAFYKPVPPFGYHALGHYGQGNYSSPNGFVAVVKEIIPGALASPVGYALIWKDSGSGADRDGAFWKPIPPAGYECPGVVVTGYDFGTGYAPPGLDEVRCVRRELLAPAAIDRVIWDDKESGADRNVSTWHVVPDSVGGVHLGLLTASGGDYGIKPEAPIYVLREAIVEGETWVAAAQHSFGGVARDALSGLETVLCNGSPASVSGSTFSCTVALNPGETNLVVHAVDRAGNTRVSTQAVISALDALDVDYATTFQRVWDDSGSGASYDGAFYRPIVTSQDFAPLGHYGQAGYGDAVGLLLLAKEMTRGALASPVGYELVWTDAGSGADNDGAFWWPLPPPGYRCLGLIATGYGQGDGYAAPSTNEVDCVRKELVAPGRVARQIWNDERSKAHRDFGSWQIVPKGGSGLHTGTFTGRSYPSDQGYAKPTRPVWVLDKRWMAGSSELREEEVRAFITTYAPVLEFNPVISDCGDRVGWFECYLLDDPQYILDHAILEWALVRNEGQYGGQVLESLASMQTSAATLLADVAHIENAIKPNPPFNSHPDFRIWLSVDDALKPGDTDVTRTRPLVHAVPRGPYTEIQFWFFYPFNGPGRTEICDFFGHCEAKQLEEAGRHYGDWEMVSLLADNRTRLMVGAGLSQHGGMEWVQYDRLEKYNGGIRPLVYVAVFSHANYRQAGTHHYEVAVHKDAYKATLFDVTTGGGPLFVVGDYILAQDEPSLLPDWLGFPYRWGQYIRNLDEIYFYGVNMYDQEEIGMGPTGPAMKSEW